MPHVRLRGKDKTVEIVEGKNLMELFVDAGIFINNPCSGKGLCGKCKVKLVDGVLHLPSPTELSLLTEEELAAGIRLSCLVTPHEDICVALLQRDDQHEVLTTGYVPVFSHQPSIKKRLICMPRPSLAEQTDRESFLMKTLEIDAIDWKVLKVLPEDGKAATAVFDEGTLIGLEVGDTVGQIYGLAVDIGTTTVVVSLIDLSTGGELASASMINAQKVYGLDVLSRITYEMENSEDGIEKLQSAIVSSLNDMIIETCHQSGVGRAFIYEICVAANTTMMHMLLGIDAVSLGRSPYAPAFICAKRMAAAEIGLRAAPGARLYCLPSVSSYIGADIVAGAYVCGLHRQTGITLFVDIGTNGEIVLAANGHLVCCSCAAGPALEGMNISAGMRASQGAVEDVSISPDGVKLSVIGNTDPAGICGSGILAVIRELIAVGLIKKDGALIKKERLDEDDYRFALLQMNGRKREFILRSGEEPLLVTQSDIRQVQLAKGAILSGFRALLHLVGISMDEVGKVLIAGQFGAHLPAESLTGTGILPEEIKDRLAYVGNTSRTGAYMALMSSAVKKELEEMACAMDYLELGASAGYERLFAESMYFPEYKGF